MATQTGSTTPQNPTIHYKLVLLGDASVGKSCLVVRYVSFQKISINCSDSLEEISMSSKSQLSGPPS